MSRLEDIVRDRSIIEGTHPTRVDSGEWEVPWQAYTVDGLHLTAHCYTEGRWEIVRARVEEQNEAVRVTLLGRPVSDDAPPTEPRQTIRLSSPIGLRHVIDPASGLARVEFTPDATIGWDRFDEAAAHWTLGLEITSPEKAASAALADGCRGHALEAVALGGMGIAAVYHERGLDVPSERAAAKVVVDAILVDALRQEPVPEWMGGWLREVADSGRIARDQFEQIAELLDLYTAIQDALDTTGDAEELMDRFILAARGLLAGGGLRG